MYINILSTFHPLIMKTKTRTTFELFVLSVLLLIATSCSTDDQTMVVPTEEIEVSDASSKRPGGAINARSSNCGTNHVQDIGQHYVKNWQSDNFDGWSCMYWDGAVNSFTVTWECKGGETLPIVFKSSDAGSSGYPKRVDNATVNNLDCSVSSSYEQWEGFSGLWGHHINIWLDDSSTPSWPYTTEIMIFENWGNHVPWEWAEWVGSLTTNGAEYECWKWYNSGNPESHNGWSYILLRKHANRRNSGTVRLKTILQWLRTKGMPNHYITSIGWGLDAFGGNTKGKWEANNIVIPNL